ncbi:unnamed protein product [Cylindrotheca closterium]|uniref:ABC1 atypical kinase-like domain-containing protein n=1 Tax=Cylindrotheca closterium TaxID=2856 RepID=A0AAD2CMA2_9STRA|nr:unnamed protein product [Cylindrotheca closterium]
MIRSGGLLRRVARRSAYGLAGSAAIGGTGVAVYTQTESGQGFKRQMDFWTSLGPIVFDYWWNLAASSPKVKLFTPELLEEENKAKKKEIQQGIHQRNAPKIFQVMLDLGGLYIKLGQVLSVTALPIPDQYREYFRTLQSNVPGHEDFEKIVKPTLEKELGKALDEIFDSVEEIPCGAASIGQAHKAILKETGERVIIKVQYPDAKWQVPADIVCVGDFLHVCVWFGLVDEDSSRLSYDEFSRQFLAELDYGMEKDNLQKVYESTLDPSSPYQAKGVVLPRVYDDLCTKQVITMTYLPGPKFEEEAKKQLAFLGIDTKKGIRSIVKDAHKETTGVVDAETAVDMMPDVEEMTNTSDQAENATVTDGKDRVQKRESRMTQSPPVWRTALTKVVSNLVTVDSIFSMLRMVRKVVLWSKIMAVKSIQLASPVMSKDWKEWAASQETLLLQAEQMDWTQKAVYALLDVHGYQILNQGLFNADPHPGNIILMNTEENIHDPKIGLIDYGQCKRLTQEERVKVARLLLSIANQESDQSIADHFRNLGIQTLNDNTAFLAEFGRLMFGSFQPKHLDHSWHRNFHKQDRVKYFPKELSMVYRTCLLLRGLAMSLQFNPSVGAEWKHYAQAAVDEYEAQQLQIQTQG